MARNASSRMVCRSSSLMHGDDVLDIAVLQVHLPWLVYVPVILQHKFQQCAHFEQWRWLRLSQLPTWWFSSLGWSRLSVGTDGGMVFLKVQISWGSTWRATGFFLLLKGKSGFRRVRSFFLEQDWILLAAEKQAWCPFYPVASGAIAVMHLVSTPGQTRVPTTTNQPTTNDQPQAQAQAQAQAPQHASW